MSATWEPGNGPPDESLDDERSWQGDNDPYLARLANEGRRNRPPHARPGPRVEGPLDDGDPYLAELAAKRFDPPTTE